MACLTSLWPDKKLFGRPVLLKEPLDRVVDAFKQGAWVVSEVAISFGVADKGITLEHFQRIWGKTRAGMRELVI